MHREAMYEDVPHVGRTYDSTSSWDGTYLRSQPTGFRVTEPTAGERSGERPRSLMDLDYEAVSQRKSLSDEQSAVIERKLSTAYIKSYTGFRLPPKCMTLNDF